MRSDQACALGNLPEDCLARASLDVVVGQRLLALRPGQNSLDQGAGLVVAGLADRQHGVEVDVRIDERRGEEPTAGVELRAPIRGVAAGRSDRDDPVAVHKDVGWLDRSATRGMDVRVADQQPRRRHLHLR